MRMSNSISGMLVRQNVMNTFEDSGPQTICIFMSTILVPQDGLTHESSLVHGNLLLPLKSMLI